jgi:plastocyanin
VGVDILGLLMGWQVSGRRHVASPLAALCAVTLAIPVRAEDKSAEQLGFVTGTVTYTSDVPLQPIADNAGRQHPLLTVHRKSRGLQDAVVYLVGKFPPDPQEGETKPPEPVLIDQQDETFTPHVVALRDGQAIRFKNSDGGNHNVRSAALDPRNEFNVFTGAGTSYQHVLHADPKQRPIRIGCDLHRWMSAWVYVFDHPYFAVTDEQGQFEIRSVPAGTYKLVVRQPDGGLSHEREVIVEHGSTTDVDVRFGGDDLKINNQ